MASPTKVIAKLEVKETAGMRRFLYPLSASVRGEFDGARTRVAEEDGNLLPSQTTSIGDMHSVLFAVSLAPNEVRRLTVVETDEVPVIPDAIEMKPSAAGGLESRQSRFIHRIDREGRIASVVYAGVEHLVGPATISLDEVEGRGAIQPNASVGEGLGGKVVTEGTYSHPDGNVDFVTAYTLTACKSWLCVHHMLHGPANGSRVVFSMPTTITGGATCDFGVGNGMYGRLEPGKVQQILWHTDLGEQTSWWIGSCAPDSPTVRVDAEGAYPGTEPNIDARSWFHLIGRDRALAAAFYADPKRASRVVVGLGEDGLVNVAFTVNKRPPSVSFAICYHFLDDIPPIAAATNPASILLPPSVTVLPA